MMQVLAAQGQPSAQPNVERPDGDILIADFGARGWNPTQPDEQLLATSGAPAASFSVAAAAPFASPEVHDVDFWDGRLNKRNGRVQVGGSLGNFPVLGLFMYVFAQTSGALTRTLVGICNSTLAYFTNGAWNLTLALLNWENAPYAFFSTFQNRLFAFPGNNPNYAPVPPVWWDGSSGQVNLLGNRASPYYLARTGAQNYFFAQIQEVAPIVTGGGPVVILAANQSGSGVYVGMTVWIDNGTYMETNTAAAFATTGTPGTSNYYVTSITLSNPLQYTAQTYTRIAWNGVQISAAATGGSISTSGNATTILVMAATSLQSGGQRASIFSVDVPNGSTGSISLEQLPFSGGPGTLFGTDLISSATQWLMTQPFNPQTPPSQDSLIFYLVPATPGVATNITSADGLTTYPGFNPAPNTISTVTFFTSPDPASWTQAAGALALDSQGYLTGQIDAPCCQFGVAWQNFMVMAGDPTHPNRLYISAEGSPQVWGTQGGLDGAYIDIPDAYDGQVITSLYVTRNGYLYVGKTNSLYVVNFTGATALTPFSVQPCNGKYGPLSPFLIEESDRGLFFLSSAGVVVVNMYSVSLLPQNEAIRSRFTGAQAYDFSAMASAQAYVNPTKAQIHFQGARAVRGDDTLVIDWNRSSFWHNTPGPTAQPAQCYTALTEDLTVSPPAIYGADGQGNVWQLDVPGTDETVPIDFYYETPWLSAGNPGAFKTLQWLSIGGTKQQANAGDPPLLNIALYVDFQPKAIRTFTFDMSKLGFPIGHNNAGGVAPQDLTNQECKYFKLALMNNQPGVPVAIRFMRINIKVEGPEL